MSLIETYNNADNAHRQEMFYEYLKKTGLKESTSKQYSMSHPSNETVLAVVNNILISDKYDMSMRIDALWFINNLIKNKHFLLYINKNLLPDR